MQKISSSMFWYAWNRNNGVENSTGKVMQSGSMLSHTTWQVVVFSSNAMEKRQLLITNYDTTAWPLYAWSMQCNILNTIAASIQDSSSACSSCNVIF